MGICVLSFHFCKKIQLRQALTVKGMTLFNANQREIGDGPGMNGLYHLVLGNRDFISDKVIFKTIDFKDLV
jgi:hypothetical protein